MKFSFLFSYWLLTWFVLFYLMTNLPFHIDQSFLQFIKTYGNPLLGLYIALFSNILLWSYIIFIKCNVRIVLTILLILCTHGIPIYMLQPYTIHYQRDILSILGLFGIYNIYLWSQSTNMYKVYKNMLESILRGDNNTPLLHLIHTFIK